MLALNMYRRISRILSKAVSIGIGKVLAVSLGPKSGQED